MFAVRGSWGAILATVRAILAGANMHDGVSAVTEFDGSRVMRPRVDGYILKLIRALWTLSGDSMVDARVGLLLVCYELL